MDLGLIRNLSEKRAGGMRKLASDIGMSEANLHRCVNNNKIQAADLEKIALILKVDIRIFFDEEVSALSNNSVHSVETNGNFSPAAMNGNVMVNGAEALLAEKVRYLEELLAEKERLIKVYERMMEERK